MEILIFVALFSATIGALLGWFSRPGGAKLVIRCALASVLVALIWSGAFTDGLEFRSVSYVATGLVYLIGPYAVFLFAPSLLCTIITYRLKPKRVPK